MKARRYDYLRYLARIGTTGVHPLGKAATEMLLEALELRPGLRLLEIGCGAGATMEQVVRIEPALLIGIDVLPDMLAAARQGLKHELNSGNMVLLQRGNETPFPFREQVFDRVYAGSVNGMQPVKIIRRIVAEGCSYYIR